MRKKFVNQVYMREVIDHTWHLEFNESINGYIALKLINKISKPLTAMSNGKKYVGLDEGYSIIEYVPLSRNYNCRVFFDKLNRPLCYYFDINNGSGIENNVPWYDDLYLDVTMECPVITEGGYYIKIDDELEFKNAKNEGKITQDQFNLGYATAHALITELKNWDNDIVNRSIHDIYRLKEIINKNN